MVMPEIRMDPHYLPEELGVHHDLSMEKVSLLKDFANDDTEPTRRKSRFTKFLSKCLLAANLCFAVGNLMFLLSMIYWGRQHQPAPQTDTLLPPSPAVSAIEKELRAFTLTSPYSEEPGPKVDQLWHKLVNTGAMFTLTPEEFTAVNDSPETGVRFAHDPEGHYFGTLAATHQIHCVNVLRKSLWFNIDHYRKINDVLFQDSTLPEEHIMHCVEMLRNAIMCAGDVSVITYNWKKGHPGPKASFRSVHSCQKWDKIEDWRSAHNVTAKVQLTQSKKEYVIGSAPVEEPNFMYGRDEIR